MENYLKSKRFAKICKISEKLINERYSEIKKIRDSVEYNEVVYETKSGIYTDFVAYLQPSDFNFSIKSGYTKPRDARKLTY